MTDSAASSPTQPWWTKPLTKNVALVLGVVMIVYAMIYADVRSRAAESYAEAEKYMAWHRDPQLKKAHFDRYIETEKQKLDRLRRRNKISDEDYRQKVDALEFDREFALQESSLKYAYQWYKDTYELFSPPESEWVTRARLKAPEALKLWKDELTSQKIPFEDYMFD